MTVTATKGVSGEVDELRRRFFEKLSRDGSPEPDGFNANDLDRIRTNGKFLNNFLEEHDMNVTSALKMLWDTCLWRQSYGANDLYESTISREYLMDGMYFIHGKDLDGKPLVIIPSRNHIRGARDLTALCRVLMYWLERIMRGNNYDKFSLIFDLTGCGYSHIDVGYTRTTLNLLINYYPNSVNHLIIYNMPWVMTAFVKLTRSFMPPKLAANMHVVQPKGLGQFLSIDNQLVSWGGTDPYEYVFEPEQLGEQSKVETKLNNSAAEDDRGVHFASNLSEESAMPDTSTINYGGGGASNGAIGGQCTEDFMLRLSPTEAIQFVKSGHDMVGTVDITNIVQHPVTYKIKTTSPDKFRVRPSSGVLAPGANNSINVVLLQGPNNAQSTLVKDKFLVMCMELSPDASTSAQDITELWKNTPSSSAQVEQHRLKCWPSSGTATYTTEMGARNGSVALNGHSFEFSGPVPARHLEATIAQLADSTVRLEAQVKFGQTLQWITMLVFLCLAIAIVYILKMEIKSSAVDYCINRH